LFLSLLSPSLPAQYFLTGEVRGPHGDKLQNVAIVVQSTGATYRSGLFGEFGILSRTMDDTVTFAADGYESYTTAIHTTGFLQVTLKTVVFPTAGQKERLNSLITKTYFRDSASVASGPNVPATSAGVQHTSAPDGGGAGGSDAGAGSDAGGGATYSSRVENPFVGQSATVSIAGEIRRESYSTIRKFLDMGSVVPPDAVKIEEMMNFFNFSYEEPERKDLFHCSSDLLSCPWNPGHKLLFLNICARKLDITRKPPTNLVFLIDASGSMDMPNKMPLIKSGFRLLVDNLREIDTVSLISYGGEVRVIFAGMPGSEKGRIRKGVEGLRPDGATPGVEGLRLAYAVARKQFIAGGNNRIVLITDGDIDANTTDERELEDFVEQQSQDGIRLTCGGIGMTSYKDSRLPVLAEKGRGNFAYLDDEPEVGQLLAGELDSTLPCVAENVSITASFNPALVKEYRLIGFDNKRSALEDTASGLGGSRIGSGHSLLALFELVTKPDSTGADTLAGIKIAYCLPGQHALQSMRYACPNDPIPFDKADIGLKRAACIAMFGMKLQRSGYGAPIAWADLEKMAKKVFSGNNFQDYEYLALIDRARKIYER
jgi:Ca-activated chloride channel family protein